MAKLTGKRKRFCHEYLKDRNATQAAKRAGYSEKCARQQGQRLLTNADISAYIAELAAEARQDRPAAIADAQEVLMLLTAFARGAEESKELVIDGMGPAHFESVPPSQQTRLNAIKELAKCLGMNVNNINMTGAVPVMFSGEDELLD